MCAAIETVASCLSLVKYVLYDYFVENRDPRLPGHYWLVQNGLLNSLSVVLVYLLFVTTVGPRWMAKREAFDLRWIIAIYNFIMASWNAYFFVISLITLKFGALIFVFDAPDPNDRSDWALAVIDSGYFYLVSKYIDLFDTVFFVLRKKFGHLSFLHLYHHSSVAFLGSLAFTLYPTSTPIGLFTTLNSAIHVLMYFYFGLCSLGPWTRPYLWWKKYITQLQIGQFGIYIVYFTAFLFLQKGYRNFLLAIGYTQAPLFAYLFVQFYRRTYLSAGAKTSKIDGVCSPQAFTNTSKLDDTNNNEFKTKAD